MAYQIVPFLQAARFLQKKQSLSALHTMVCRRPRRQGSSTASGGAGKNTRVLDPAPVCRNNPVLLVMSGKEDSRQGAEVGNARVVARGPGLKLMRPAIRGGRSKPWLREDGGGTTSHSLNARSRFCRAYGWLSVENLHLADGRGKRLRPHPSMLLLGYVRGCACEARAPAEVFERLFLLFDPLTVHYRGLGQLKSGVLASQILVSSS